MKRHPDDLIANLLGIADLLDRVSVDLNDAEIPRCEQHADEMRGAAQVMRDWVLDIRWHVHQQERKPDPDAQGMSA